MINKLYISVLIIINISIGYFFGSHEITIDAHDVHCSNVKESLDSERKLCNAVFEMLHQYWEHYDAEYDKDDNVINRHNFFDDCISESDSYITADSIMNGDWEDFFYHWDSNEDVCNHHIQAFKDGE